MGVQDLSEIVVDASRPLLERRRALDELRRFGVRFPELAWREAVHAPLRAQL